MDGDAATTSLAARPDWLYLLREFDALYRRGTAGGSAAIRAHRRRVRDAISAAISADAPLVRREAAAKPVTVHLPRAFDLGARGAVSGLSRALERVAPKLVWEYGYPKVPPALARKYAYCEVLGPQGPIRSERLILGFVLFAPKTVYPQHSHADIEESYVSVAGDWSENDAAVYAPGSMILNRPGAEHRITTGDFEPCLLAYAWTGPEDRLAQPGMKLSATRRARVVSGI